MTTEKNLDGGFGGAAPLGVVREKMLPQILGAFPEAVLVYLFGSRARGLERPDSDWDLALLFPRGQAPKPGALLILNAELSKIAGAPVEISLLDAEKFLIHAKEVVSEGILVFSKDENSRLDFETRVLSGYARLCEDRRPVIEAYSRHG